MKEKCISKIITRKSTIPMRIIRSYQSVSLYCKVLRLNLGKYTNRADSIDRKTQF